MSYVQTVVSGEALVVGGALVRVYHDGPRRMRLVVDAAPEVVIARPAAKYPGVKLEDLAEAAKKGTLR